MKIKMKKSKYITLDIESGGLSTETSLLTVALAVLDDKLNIVDRLYLQCKPADGFYKVTGRAMEINGIDLAKHDKEAVTYKEASSVLYEFLKKNKPNDSMLIPFGQNVKFDCLRICESICKFETWDSFVSYRVLDLGSISGYLIDVGLLPKDLKAGLSNMCEYFGIGKQAEKHDAREDILLNINLFKKLKGVLLERLEA